MLYLDSADPDDVVAASAFGFVSGVTTNPTLMRRHTTEPLEHLARLIKLFCHGPVMYQPTTDDVEQAELEARTAFKLAPDQVVVKLPARLDHVQLAARLSSEGIPCALTAVFSPGQALLAHESACRWIIPYVDRSASEERAGHNLVRQLASLLGCLRSDTRILAASVKSIGQALTAIEDGAHAVSVPLEVIRNLAVHPLTDEAIQSFVASSSDRSGERTPDSGRVRRHHG